MSDYEHLHPDVRALAMKTREERIDWLKSPRWFGYARANELLGKFEDLLNYPRQDRMPNMLLLGASNNGKTHLVKRFTKRHPRQMDLSQDYIHAPVIFVDTPSAPTEVALYHAILKSLFEKVPGSNPHVLRYRVIDVLRGVRLKVLILDDLNNMLASARNKQLEVLNTLKFLGNELQLSIIGCGTGDLARAVGVDPQFENRFPPEGLPKWGMSDAEAAEEYRMLLGSFEAVMPLRRPSDLTEDTLAQKIAYMSGGFIGEISTLLNKAATYAISNGSEHITETALNKCGYTPESERRKKAARM